MEKGGFLTTHTRGFDFKAIFHSECANNKKCFDKGDDIRRRIYFLLSNSRNLSQKCVKLIKEFNSYVENKLIIIENYSFDLMGILRRASEITEMTEEYKPMNLTPVLFTKRCPSLFTELVLEANCNKKTNIKSKVTANAYEEVENKSIGKQHIMYTTQIVSISDSSRSEDDDSDSPLSARWRKRNTSKKAGNFELAGHENNSSFNNTLKCQVEILILVGNKSHCRTLANHLALIWFEGLLEGEEYIEHRLQNCESTLYRLAHTEIIKKMMNGYSSICITTSTSAWEYIPASTKAFIYTRDDEHRLYDCHHTSANFCVLLEDNDILDHIDAIGKIVAKASLCSILLQANYKVDEKTYTTIQLPITVLIPLYIIKYFTQSFFVTHEAWSKSKDVEIFQYKCNV